MYDGRSQQLIISWYQSIHLHTVNKTQTNVRTHTRTYIQKFNTHNNFRHPAFKKKPFHTPQLAVTLQVSPKLDPEKPVLSPYPSFIHFQRIQSVVPFMRQCWHQLENLPFRSMRYSLDQGRGLVRRQFVLWVVLIRLVRLLLWLGIRILLPLLRKCKTYIESVNIIMRKLNGFILLAATNLSP